MTDIERTKSFLDSLGILYANDNNKVVFGMANPHDDDYPECKKVIGYRGFYTTFNFHEDGSFENVGIYE